MHLWFFLKKHSYGTFYNPMFDVMKPKDDSLILLPSSSFKMGKTVIWHIIKNWKVFYLGYRSYYIHIYINLCLSSILKTVKYIRVHCRVTITRFPRESRLCPRLHRLSIDRITFIYKSPLGTDVPHTTYHAYSHYNSSQSVQMTLYRDKTGVSLWKVNFF